MKLLILMFVVFMVLSGCDVNTPQKTALSVASLNFEQSTPDRQPLGWYVEADAATVLVNVNESPSAFEGQSVLSVANSGEQPAVIYTPVPQSADCIRTVDITLQARSSEVNGAVAPVLLESGANGPVVGPFEPIGADWMRISNPLSGAGECLAQPAYFGFLMMGSSEIDSVSIMANGETMLAYDDLLPASKADLTVLANVSVAADMQGGGAALQAGIKRKVIALGETSHGAAALFAMKLSVLKALSSKDLTVFALEMPAAAADIVDDYVSGRSDDRDRSIRAMIYPAWQTAEMLEMVDWLREYNASAERPIIFAGFDIQQPYIALQQLEKQWANDPAMLKPVSDAIREGGEVQQALISLEGMMNDVDLTEAEARYLRLIQQGMLADRPDLGGQSRDAYMAAEALIIINNSSGQVILSGDNTHITKAKGAMGAYLADELGDDYLAVGLTFSTGNYSAMGPSNPYVAESAYEGTHEKLLEKAGIDGRFVALADLPDDHPLLEVRGFRYIGSRPQEFGQFLPHHLQLHFDVIGHVNVSDATNFLLRHDF